MGLIKSNSRWASVTPLLIFTVVTYSWGNVMYGLDTGSFGSQQALPSFLRVFGDLQPNGTYVLPTERKSIMNSVTWIGKALGCALFEPVVSRVGYKWVMVLVVVLQCVGVIVEMTATNWIAFSSGRVVAYLGVGFVENAVPSYESEIAPAALRGFISGSLILLTTLGNLWGALMSRGYQNEVGKHGYIIPVAMQLIPPILIAIGLPFTPESPRWLVSQDRHEDALKALNRIRPKRDVDSGVTQHEVQAFSQAIEEDRAVSQGRWLDLFRGNYFRRIMIAMWLFIFQQWTGGQFVLSYGPTFYVQLGLGAQAFTYNVLTQAISLIGCIITILFLDKVGRRPFLIVGTFFQVLFMCLVAGLGGQSNPTGGSANGMVAAVMLFNLSVKVSLSTNAYLIASEIGGVRMRKKIISVATLTDVVAAFVITWTMPYLLNTNGSGVNLGARVGWIFAGIAFCALVFVTFFVPEFSSRSLEEVDELFGAKLWAWQFKGYQTSGVGARIRAMEAGQGEDVAKDASRVQVQVSGSESADELTDGASDRKDVAYGELAAERKV